MVNKEDQYKTTMFIDLIYFLMAALLVDNTNKKELMKDIIESWAVRNEKLVKKSLEEQAKFIISKDERLFNKKDEIGIILSAQELVFNSIRKDLVDILIKGISENFEMYEQAENEEENK